MQIKFYNGTVLLPLEVKDWMEATRVHRIFPHSETAVCQNTSGAPAPWRVPVIPYEKQKKIFKLFLLSIGRVYITPKLFSDAVYPLSYSILLNLP